MEHLKSHFYLTFTRFISLSLSLLHDGHWQMRWQTLAHTRRCPLTAVPVASCHAKDEVTHHHMYQVVQQHKINDKEHNTPACRCIVCIKTSYSMWKVMPWLIQLRNNDHVTCFLLYNLYNIDCCCLWNWTFSCASLSVVVYCRFV